MPKYNVKQSWGREQGLELTALQLVALLGSGSVPHGVEDTVVAPTERWRRLANLPTVAVPALRTIGETQTNSNVQSARQYGNKVPKALPPPPLCLPC